MAAVYHKKTAIVSDVLVFGSVNIFSSGFHIILVEWVQGVARILHWEAT